MKLRQRQKYRFNSIISLAIFVFLGVVVSTLVHAEGRSVVVEYDAAAWSNARQAGNHWLLPGGVRTSGPGGMYHLRMVGASAQAGRGSAASWAGRMNLIFRIKYVEESGRQILPTVRPVPAPGMRQPLSPLHRGSLLWMSVGRHWQ